jgi:ornithine cyclodeaminase
MVLGLKAGGYWPENTKKGLSNHQSTTFLFDPQTGRVEAAIGANLLTALRTAAASAVSIKHLRPKGSSTLGIIGAGHQAVFQIRAALALGGFERVVGWNRTPGRLENLRVATEELGVRFESLELDGLGREADVIITIASAFEPLLLDQHVKGPTHIAAMGTDTRGKQELDPGLLSRADLFSDSVAQSLTIGEFQHLDVDDSAKRASIRRLGDLIVSDQQRPRSELTIFDGTGVGTQDIAVANAVLAMARESGVAQWVEI